MSFTRASQSWQRSRLLAAEVCSLSFGSRVDLSARSGKSRNSKERLNRHESNSCPSRFSTIYFSAVSLITLSFQMVQLV